MRAGVRAGVLWSFYCHGAAHLSICPHQFHPWYPLLPGSPGDPITASVFLLKARVRIPSPLLLPSSPRPICSGPLPQFPRGVLGSEAARLPPRRGRGFLPLFREKQRRPHCFGRKGKRSLGLGTGETGETPAQAPVMLSARACAPSGPPGSVRGCSAPSRASRGQLHRQLPLWGRGDLGGEALGRGALGVEGGATTLGFAQVG